MNALRNLSLLLLGLILAGWVVGHQVAYILDPSMAAIVVQLGKPVGEPRMAPGLYFKLPFIQTVLTFDRRLLDYDTTPKDVITKDKKQLIVDYYAKWRIVDPLMFYTSVRDVNGALSRLEDIIYSELRVEFGSHVLHQIVSEVRDSIMRTVTARADKQMRQFGMSVVDVRIKRADLPEQNATRVFERMRAEREREAAEFRSQGTAEANRIRATADREVTVLKADATRKGEELRGTGDAERNRIFAEAYGKDADFFGFYRSMQAYEQAIKAGDSKLILSPDSPFFKYFNDPSGLAPKP